MITFGVTTPLLPPEAAVPLQLTIFTCLLLLMTIVPTAAAAAVAGEDCDDVTGATGIDDAAATAADDDDVDVAEDEARPWLLADHEFCFTTITPGLHCWCCWRI